MRKLVIIAMLFLAACAGGTDETILDPVEFSDLPGWKKDQLAEPFRLFVDSCKVNARRATPWRTRLGEGVGEAYLWKQTCASASKLQSPTEAQARQFFESHFAPFRVKTGKESKGLLTGYYEPLLHGSVRREGVYQTPVYGVPAGGGHYSRAQIENGALKNRAQVLLYVDDPVMLFFLHIQGSGKVRLTDGTLVGLQYAAQNGYPYVAIGKVMRDKGMLTEVSLQTIRDWLRANPQGAQAVMNENPSYVYFKLSPGQDYAKGAIGIPLTPLRSVAIDDDRAAYGVPTYIATWKTDYQTGYRKKLRRLFVSQDTGGALHGPHRGDMFFGRGDAEEHEAGLQNAQGRVFWLLPVPPRRLPNMPDLLPF